MRRRGAGLRPAAGAIAAALAASVALVVWPAVAPAPTPLVYATARGERRAILLADGTRLELNALSRVSVRLGRRDRRVQLLEGEAAFDVAHHAERPFVVTTSGGEIRDLGTEFDVRQRNGLLTLTVRRGAVDFRPAGPASAHHVRLAPGQRLERRAGDPAIQVRMVAPEDAFSWRSGRLVLRDEPLRAVVEDLNPYFEHPVRIASAELAQLRVSGVLRLDSEATTLHRLTLFAPIKAERRGGEVLLRPAGAAAPSS